MGDLSGTFVDSPEAQIAQDKQVVDPPDGKIKTDVENCFADAEYQGFPVFDVSKNEFYNNMRADRQRLRFKSETSAQAYHKQTHYKTPFYIRNIEDGYMRKIK